MRELPRLTVSLGRRAAKRCLDRNDPHSAVPGDTQDLKYLYQLLIRMARMRIAIVANDTRGGVEPYAALARGLAAAGHAGACCRSPRLPRRLRRHGGELPSAGRRQSRRHRGGVCRCGHAADGLLGEGTVAAVGSRRARRRGRCRPGVRGGGWHADGSSGRRVSGCPFRTRPSAAVGCSQLPLPRWPRAADGSVGECGHPAFPRGDGRDAGCHAGATHASLAGGTRVDRSRPAAASVDHLRVQPAGRAGRIRPADPEGRDRVLDEAGARRRRSTPGCGSSSSGPAPW